MLELPALGLAGQAALNLAETDEDLRDYWQWRGLFARSDTAGDDSGPPGDDSGPPGVGAAAHAGGASPVILLCRHCQSRKVFKGGRDKRGTQRFLCRDCKRSFHKAEDDCNRNHTAAFRAQVMAAYQEGASMPVVCQAFGITHRMLARWLKESSDPPAFDPPAAR